MKRIIKNVIIFLCAAVFSFAFVGCSDPGAPEHNVSPEYAVSSELPAAYFRDFMTALGPDRTSYTAAERAAATYLYEQLESIGFAGNELLMQEFSVRETVQTRDGDKSYDVTSQNVIAYHRAANSGDNTKNVVLGAYYDNRFGTAYEGDTAFKSPGALANGTGVATLLAIADYLKTNDVQLDFDVTVVFFGASYVTTAGARMYYREGMSAAERENTVLMVELQRIVGDHVYAFSDARETRREKLFDDVSKANGLDIYKVTQKSPPVGDVSSLEGVPYFQWAHNGVFCEFFNAGIPTLNLIGANWETIDFRDRETSARENISYTENDTYEKVIAMYPNDGYADRMATAATLVIRSLEHPDFLSTLAYDREHFPDTSALTNTWIWYLTVAVVVVLMGIAIVLIPMRLTKKYPIEPEQPPRMKMAVFGMDYEDKDAADVFIDMRPANEEIFPGVPNNDAPPDPLDDIFPPVLPLPDETPSDAVSTPPTEEKTESEAPTEQPVEEAEEKAENEDPVERPDEATEEKAENEAPAERPDEETEEKAEREVPAEQPVEETEEKAESEAPTEKPDEAPEERPDGGEKRNGDTVETSKPRAASRKSASSAPRTSAHKPIEHKTTTTARRTRTKKSDEPKE